MLSKTDPDQSRVADGRASRRGHRRVTTSPIVSAIKKAPVDRTNALSASRQYSICCRSAGTTVTPRRSAMRRKTGTSYAGQARRRATSR